MFVRGLSSFVVLLLLLNSLPDAFKSNRSINGPRRFNQTLYKVPPNQSQKLLPMLLPGVLIKVEVDVECLDPNRPAEQIKVLVLNPASAVPFVSAIVQMPPSDVIDD